jgi:hypothetical protein
MKKVLCAAVSLFVFSQCLAGDVYIHEWNVSKVRVLLGDPLYRLKFHIRNSGGSSGFYKIELHGKDSSGYPIVKEPIQYRAYLPAFGEIKDSDDVLINGADDAQIKTWELVVTPL